jgi:putative membrane protein
MRWVYLTLIVLLAAATLIFIIQNRDLVTMSFLGFSIRAPLAILIAAVYVVGAVTGGSLFALLRRSYRARNAIPRSSSSRGSIAGVDRGLCNNVISRAPPGYDMTVPSVT